MRDQLTRSWSDRLLYTGAAVGALGVIFLWRKVGGFWVGGLITAASCGLVAVHYGLRAMAAPPVASRKQRRALSLAAAVFITILALGLLYLSALALMGQPNGAVEKMIGNALPIMAIVFSVFVILDSFTDSDD